MELSLKSITASSVAEFSLLDEEITQSSGSNSQGIFHMQDKSSYKTMLKQQHKRQRQVSLMKKTRSIGVQTDSYFFNVQETEEEQEETEVNDESETEREIEQICWKLSLSQTSDQQRPTAPDVESMTIGHRLSTNNTPHTQPHTLKHPLPDTPLDMPPLQHFSIMPPTGNTLAKPTPTRPSSIHFIDYLPTSPPSSEITVPSDNVSDISTINSSIISTPNSAKYVAIISQLDAHKSAFSLVKGVK